MKLFLAFVLFSIAALASSESIRVPRLKKAGAFNSPVIAQSKPEVVKKNARAAIARRYYISKLGVHRFEYGYVDYLCQNGKCRQQGETQRVQVYESCKGLSRSGRPKCSDSVVSQYGSREQTLSGRNWYTCDDYGNPCGETDELNDYPGRYSPEDPQFGLNF